MTNILLFYKITHDYIGKYKKKLQNKTGIEYYKVFSEESEKFDGICIPYVVEI